MSFGSPKVPKVEKPVPPAPVIQASAPKEEAARKEAALPQGLTSLIATGMPLGLKKKAFTIKSSLLG